MPPVKKKQEPVGVSPKVMAGVVVVAVVFVLFMYNAYVHPFTSTVKIPQKVAPLPGFLDQYPYNTKEWQDKFKQGKAGFLSGVPRYTTPPGNGGSPGGQPTPPVGGGSGQ